MGQVRFNSKAERRRAAREALRVKRDTAETNRNLSRLMQAARHMAGPEQLDAWLAADTALTDEMRAAIRMLMLPMLPKPEDKQTIVLVTEANSRVH